YRLIDERSPLLPEDCKEAMCGDLVTRPPGLQPEINDVFGTRTTWMSVPVIFLFLLFFCPFPRLRTFEGRAYDWLVALILTAIYMMLLGNWLRFMLLWKDLRMLLQSLERHPMRQAFTRLPPSFSWTSIWSGSVRPTYLTLTRSRDCLRALVPEMRENVGDKLQLIEAQEKDPAKQYGPEQLQALRALQKLYAIQACKVAAEILKPEWDGGTCDSISEARRRARR